MLTTNNSQKVIEFGNPTILSLGEMVRYNNRSKIKKENVATHSWIASAAVIKICKEFSISKEIMRTALEMIVVHDIGELATNDIPYDFKQANPEIREMLEKAELAFLKEKYPEFYESYKTLLEMEKVESIVAVIVKLADAISVLQYTNNEILLGNQTDGMNEINLESKERVSMLIDKLKQKLA